MSLYSIRPGDMFVPLEPSARDSHRRIVTVHGNKVAWCNGGEIVHTCLYASFTQWIRRVDACQRVRREKRR